MITRAGVTVFPKEVAIYYPVGHKSEYEAKHSENNHHERAAYVFGCVRQLLFDSFHNLPEGGSV